MAYYPKSQVKTNLHTNGGEYAILTTNEEYKGGYYIVSTGKIYAGPNPQFQPKIELIPLTTIPSSYERSTIVQNNTTQTVPPRNNEPITTIFNPSYTPLSQNRPEREIPTFRMTLPTDDDKILGYFNRYFCKKNNELRYFEIDQTTHSKISQNDPNIAWDLYSSAEIRWEIYGDITSVYSQNFASVSSVENRLKWYGFSQYFKSQFSKYYLES